MKNKHSKVNTQWFTFLKTTLKDINKKRVFLPVKVRSWSTSKIIFVSQAKFGALLFIFLTRKKTRFIRKISDLIRFQKNFLVKPINQSLHFKFGLGMIISFHSFSNCQKKSHCILEILMRSRSNMN